jgi:Rps23 Pro-64 3,4-dihydroxylase Tpa1-like proline 4-hydroxylase
MNQPLVFRINSSIDPDGLNPSFRAAGRLHIPAFLDPPCAEALISHLQHEVEWSYFLFTEGHLCEVPPEARALYDAEQERTLSSLAHSEGRRGYGFLYETNRLSMRSANGELQRAQHGGLLKGLVSFLNSPPFIDFVRRLTGTGEIEWVEATATCFRPGHFLAFHDDSSASTRRIAYVINLTREWRPEWGGLLEFMSSSGHIAEAYVPRFNSLNIFRVPMAHAVSCVSPSAGTLRLAISGWLHGRQACD